MDLLELSANETYYRGTGHTSGGNICPYCKGKGYKGRIGIYELLPLFRHPGWEKFVEKPNDLRTLMMGFGYTDLYGDAMRKVRDKLVSPDSIVGVIAPVNNDTSNYL